MSCRRCGGSRWNRYAAEDGFSDVCAGCGWVRPGNLETMHRLLSPKPERTHARHACHMCGREVRDADVCSWCSERASKALGDVPALEADLETTISRQTRFGADDGTHGKGADPPSPIAVHAAEVRHELRAILVSWCLLYAEENRADPPTDTLAAMSAYLLRRVEHFRHHDLAMSFIEEVTDAVDRCDRACDAPPRTIFVGPCPEDGCPGQVRLTLARESTMACPECGAKWNTSNDQMSIGAKRILDVMMADCEEGNHRWRGKKCWVCEAARPEPNGTSASPMRHAG